MKTALRTAVVGGLATAVGLCASFAILGASGAGSSDSPSDGNIHVLKEIAPTKVISWRDADATLTPLPSSADARIGFVAATTALGDGLKNALSLPEVAGQPTAGLYSYKNDQYGAIQDDGSIRLTYVKTPVWLVTIPLTGPLTNLVQQPAGATADPVERSGCSYYYIVDATSGEFLTSGQHCDYVGE